MAGKPSEWSSVLSNAVLCVVSLSSAVRTSEVNRGAAAGFLLQALAALLGAAGALWPSLGLSLEADSPPNSWVSTVVGLPLVAFGFHWLNGDHSTANLLLGGALLLAAGSGYLTEEGRTVVARSVALVTAITILILSVFTTNACGMLGSLALGAAGLLSGAGLDGLPLLAEEDAVCYLLAAGSLALQQALRTQHRELEQEAQRLLSAW
ncbi:cysteine and histidine-rich protein 1 [Alligator sinensis]|uniref:Cysteine and histidine-rich protein 1 n=1 Tax=Alligator sinensis TaxID=38654 RepID=A0A1U8DRQ9_ALLSI|nr:cysteine and histidine-rich protein 1 [Alligator sinensis]XP_014383037.1 cysteine and histidine-rich protein 1 [Alligator sinensis]XP_014383038.1 cysteine and histidine-rich protein 1 [Alligator sinensis]XP_014383039.1 cysteine and histidine-rich protein 1 [Alligator sinensis]XP_014383041.1 cysteine and histidine-rich protein 1 [Alligator sinensis]